MLMLSRYIGIGLGCVVDGFSVVSVFSGCHIRSHSLPFYSPRLAIFCRARCVCAEILGPGGGVVVAHRILYPPRYKKRSFWTYSNSLIDLMFL